MVSQNDERSVFINGERLDETNISNYVTYGPLEPFVGYRHFKFYKINLTDLIEDSNSGLQSDFIEWNKGAFIILFTKEFSKFRGFQIIDWIKTDGATDMGNHIADMLAEQKEMMSQTGELYKT